MKTFLFIIFSFMFFKSHENTIKIDIKENKKTEIKQEYIYNLNEIFTKICKIESNNDSLAIGDNNKAYGIAQIHKACLKDTRLPYKHKDMFSSQKSKEVFFAYISKGIILYYKKYQKPPSEQDIVRMWNGGIYNGYKNKKTLKYYERYKNLSR